MRTGPLGKARRESLALLNVTKDEGLFVFRNKGFVEKNVLIDELFFLGECLALGLVGLRGLGRRWWAFSRAVIHGCVGRLEEREDSDSVGVKGGNAIPASFCWGYLHNYTGVFPRPMNASD